MRHVIRCTASIVTAATLVALAAPTAKALDSPGQLSFLLLHGDYPISQGYLNYNPVNPPPDRRHAGIDIAAPLGTTLYSPISGVCVRAGGSYGYASIYNA